MTNELIHEIKQLKVQQQHQLNMFYKDLQHSLNQKLQFKFDEQPVIQFNQINVFETQQRQSGTIQQSKLAAQDKIPVGLQNLMQQTQLPETTKRKSETRTGVNFLIRSNLKKNKW